MTFNWPKRDEDGRHVTEPKVGDEILNDKGERCIIGHTGPEIMPVGPMMTKVYKEKVGFSSRDMYLFIKDTLENSNSLAETISKMKSKYGECGGPEIKPLSELIAKLDPDVVERAMADTNRSIECSVCKGHIRYYTFDYTKGVYVTNYCEHV